MKTGVSVAAAMTSKPVTIKSEETILRAVQLMRKNRVGSILVLKNEVLKGIFTEHDLVHVIAKEVNVKKTKVGEVMTKRIHSVQPTDDLSEAIHHMQKNKVRRLPVVYKNKLIGLLTQQDIVRIEPALWELMIGREVLKMKKKKEKYFEGECDICENFAQLHEFNDQYICAECLEEEGEKPEEDKEE